MVRRHPGGIHEPDVALDGQITVFAVGGRANDVEQGLRCSHVRPLGKGIDSASPDLRIRAVRFRGDGLQGLCPPDPRQRPDEVGPPRSLFLFESRQDEVGTSFRIRDQAGGGRERVLKG